MAYFNNITTLEQLRKQYRDLLKIHHPDNGGNVSQMQEINAEYDKLFKILKDKHDSNTTGNGNSNGKESEYSKNMYNWENDKALRETLGKIINFNGIEIQVIGQWIWVSGNTYKYKKELKEIGFKWASQKKMWHWHSELFRKKSRKTLSISEIKSYYGSTKIQTGEINAIEA